MVKPTQVINVQQKWEYSICFCTLGDISDDLNAHTNENWELVNILPGHDLSEHNEGRCMCIYKRPVDVAT